jgi:coproporphyrinogen III oxidase-like Fe-S oxidoreductase
MEYDIHTTPQAPWLQGITPRLFKLENIKKLWDHLRITADVHHQKRIEPTLELQPEHEAAILDFYADDFKLWENAE